MLVAALCAALAVLGACGRNDEEPDALPTVEPSVVATDSPAPTPCALEDASRDPKKTEGTPPFAAVTDVRPNASSGCPRVVFEFKGDQHSGYLVELTEPPFDECGSGKDVNTSGWDAEGFLRVRLEPSASVDTMADYKETYTGPRDMSLEGDVLKHMKVTCDFEGVFEWVVGLDQERPFAVSTLLDPPRLVIDISGA